MHLTIRRTTRRWGRGDRMRRLRRLLSVQSHRQHPFVSRNPPRHAKEARTVQFVDVIHPVESGEVALQIRQVT